MRFLVLDEHVKEESHKHLNLNIFLIHHNAKENPLRNAKGNNIIINRRWAKIDLAMGVI